MKEKKSKERKLSKAEQKRKEAFEQLTEKLMAQGYKPGNLLISPLEANVLSVVIVLPFVVALLIAYSLVGHEIQFSNRNLLISYVGFILFIVVHELIHGATWAFFAEGGWKTISFGFNAEYLTPYCNCNQPLKKKHMIIGALMPTIILGVLMGAVAVISGSTILLFIAVLMLFGGGGDMLVTMKLLRYKSVSEDVLFIDHPYEVGTAVFEKVD